MGLLCPENGVVLDPFSGSGATGAAALKNNRQFIGSEINPEYATFAEGRIQQVRARHSVT
jgi:DNA modification methylase